MKITQCCSWCQAANDAPAGEPVTCHECGHRGDLPRALCDCQQCGMVSMARLVALTASDREQITQAAARAFTEIIRRENTLVRRATVQTALAAGVSYEIWRREFGLMVNSRPAMQQTLRNLSVLGVDVEAVLRQGYDAATKRAVQ